MIGWPSSGFSTGPLAIPMSFDLDPNAGIPWSGYGRWSTFGVSPRGPVETPAGSGAWVVAPGSTKVQSDPRDVPYWSAFVQVLIAVAVPERRCQIGNVASGRLDGLPLATMLSMTVRSELAPRS